MNIILSLSIVTYYFPFLYFPLLALNHIYAVCFLHTCALRLGCEADGDDSGVWCHLGGREETDRGIYVHCRTLSSLFVVCRYY